MPDEDGYCRPGSSGMSGLPDDAFALVTQASGLG